MMQILLSPKKTMNAKGGMPGSVACTMNKQTNILKLTAQTPQRPVNIYTHLNPPSEKIPGFDRVRFPTKMLQTAKKMTALI